MLLYALEAVFLTAAVVLLATRLWTTLAYYQTLRQYAETPHGGSKVVDSPQLPYTLPWLGNTFSFLNKNPGKYWSNVFDWFPKSVGVLSLLIAGRKTHILYSPSAVQALFKAKSPTRDEFEQEMFTKVFGLDEEQTKNALHGKHFETELNAKYMTNFDKVNELTAHFMRVLDEVLDRDAEHLSTLGDTGLYSWLRDRMFEASVTALMGETLLPMYPAWTEDFFRFEHDFLSFFFGTPVILNQEAVERRKRIIDNLEHWSLEMHRLSGGAPIDPEGPAWEPLLGSRLNRARQLDYKNRRLNTRSGACFDAGMTFGLASNVIPATGWMLFQILNPKAPPNLFPRVLAEVEAAQSPDGTLDVHKLVAQPLLQSIWIETLRLYSDLLVTRSLTEDITLPLDEDGKLHVRLHKGDNVFAPSWISHHSSSWSTDQAPHDVFDPDRFLATDPKTGESTFVFSKTAGKFFPFGGGKTICPGRIFAKQEALGALGLVLLRFKFGVKGFVDANKNLAEDFPGFRRAFPGSGALTPGGDLLVSISKR